MLPNGASQGQFQLDIPEASVATPSKRKSKTRKRRRGNSVNMSTAGPIETPNPRNRRRQRKEDPSSLLPVPPPLFPLPTLPQPVEDIPPQPTTTYPSQMPAAPLEPPQAVLPLPPPPPLPPHCDATQPLSSGPAGNKTGRKAVDVWTFYKQVNGKQVCTFCLRSAVADTNYKVMEYSIMTGTTVLCGHLIDDHDDEWFSACKTLCLSITTKDAQPALIEYECWHGNPRYLATMKTTASTCCIPFSNEAFVDALTEFIIADDQSINVVECQQLRNIFLMLQEELCEGDIPHRMTIRAHILEMWSEHIAQLKLLELEF